MKSVKSLLFVMVLSLSFLAACSPATDTPVTDDSATMEDDSAAMDTNSAVTTDVEVVTDDSATMEKDEDTTMEKDAE